MNDILKVSEVNKCGFGIIPKMVMQDSELSITAKAIYAYFCSFAGAGDTCFPTRKKICSDLNVSKDTLGKYILELSQKGYISVYQNKEDGKFSNNVYTLNTTISPCPKSSDTETTVSENTVSDRLATKNNNIKNNNNKEKENKKEKTSREKNFDSIISEFFTDSKTVELIWQWIESRKQKNKLPTDNALRMNLSKLGEVASKSGMNVNSYLEDVICRGWLAFYPLGNNFYGNNQKCVTGQNNSELEQVAKIVPRDF